MEIRSHGKTREKAEQEAAKPSTNPRVETIKVPPTTRIQSTSKNRERVVTTAKTIDQRDNTRTREKEITEEDSTKIKASSSSHIKPTFSRWTFLNSRIFSSKSFKCKDWIYKTSMEAKDSPLFLVKVAVEVKTSMVDNKTKITIEGDTSKTETREGTRTTSTKA